MLPTLSITSVPVPLVHVPCFHPWKSETSVCTIQRDLVTAPRRKYDHFIFREKCLHCENHTKYRICFVVVVWGQNTVLVVLNMCDIYNTVHDWRDCYVYTIYTGVPKKTYTHFKKGKHCIKIVIPNLYR
jgi:hypothetical protein